MQNADRRSHMVKLSLSNRVNPVRVTDDRIRASEVQRGSPVVDLIDRCQKKTVKSTISYGMLNEKIVKYKLQDGSVRHWYEVIDAIFQPGNTIYDGVASDIEIFKNKVNELKSEKFKSTYLLHVKGSDADELVCLCDHCDLIRKVPKSIASPSRISNPPDAA